VYLLAGVVDGAAGVLNNIQHTTNIIYI